MLEGIADDDLRVFVVWEPILRPDNERAARRATTMLDDPRVTHFWTMTRDVGTSFETPIGLKGEPAWDVYLLYPRGTRWEEAPPPPDFYMHQMRGRLPEDRVLDGRRLAAETRRLLAAGHAPAR